MIRRLLIAAAFAVAAAVAGPGVAPGPAAAAGACDGVWVIVEPGPLGGSASQRCAAGSPSSGLAALEAAGHSYTFVPRVPGLVCTIDARPDPCNGAPEDAYWSYWHAAEGATSWTYSTKGAGNRTPPPGSAEAWRFGSGDPPSTPPPAAEPEPEPEKPKPKPEPETTSPPAGSDSTGGAGGGGSTSGPGSGSGSGSGAGSTPTPGDDAEDRGGTAAPDDDPGASASGGRTTTSAGDGAATSATDAPDDGTTVDPTAREQEAAPSVRAMEGPDADDPDADDEADDDEDVDDDDVAADQPVDGTVRVEPPGGGRGLVGTAVAGTLVAGLAAAGIVRARRRNLDGPDGAAWLDGPDG